MLEFYQLLHKFRFDKFSSLSYFKIPPSHLFPPPPPAHPRPPISLSSAFRAAPCSTSTPNAAEGVVSTLRRPHTRCECDPRRPHPAHLPISL